MTMDTAGKAVLFSGADRADLALRGDARAEPGVPLDGARDHALGVFVLAATLTLLPAVLAKLGPRVDRLALRWVHSGEHRSARFAAWGELLWRRPWLFGSLALAVLLALALPIVGLRTGMPSIKVVPTGDSSRVGYAQVQQAFGPGAPGALQIVGPAEAVSDAARDRAARPRHRARAPAAHRRERAGARRGDPERRPVEHERRPRRSTACARPLPAGALVGGAAAENHDLEQAAARARTPLVIGVVLALGFLLLLVALQAPLIAAAGVLTNLLATGAAFGVARLVFQDGHGAGCSASSRRASSTRGGRSSSSR